MALTQTEINRNFIKQRKENGLCVLCGKKLDRKGIRCISCNEEMNKYHRDTWAWRLEHKICPRCGKNDLLGDEKRCPECLAKSYDSCRKSKEKLGAEHCNEVARKSTNNVRKKRKEAGLCPRCGKRKPDNGFTTCGVCREKARNYMRTRHGYCNNVSRFERGICYFCNNPLKDGYKVCEKHYQMNIEKLNNDKRKEATEQIKKSNKIFYVKRKK